MVINSGDGIFLDGETIVKSELVFLEKADAPTSLMARGVPIGMLILTNRRLFFLSKDRAESINSKSEFLSRYVYLKFTGLEIEPIPVLHSGLNLEPFLESEYSLVVPIEHIISCEKFGKMFTLNGKKRFLRIGILLDNDTKVNYCVYYNSPLGSSSLLGPNYVNHSDWLEKINAVKT